MNRLVIIGGGAAGLFAGIKAAENRIKVTILEHGISAGKKILSTGNGKCNMTNINMSVAGYYGNSEFVESVISDVTPQNIINMFEDMGLLVRDRDGYVYPYSGQASTVRKLLVNTCNELGVDIVYECNISNVEKQDDVFVISTDRRVFQSDYLLIATGGKSFPKSGSDGSGFGIAQQFGHKINQPVPALTSVICNEKYTKNIAGVRAKAKIAVDDMQGNKYNEQGEVQFTDYGLSGIPVFNLSRTISYALKRGKKPIITVDIIPEYTKEQIKKCICNNVKFNGNRRIADQMAFLINDKLALLILELANINKDTKLKELTAAQIDLLINKMKKLVFNAANVKGFDFAQVTAGGVDTDEIDKDTMESKIVPGLYFAGEIIDVDGICGGYNLHFAWASAYIASKGMK